MDIVRFLEFIPSKMKLALIQFVIGLPLVYTMLSTTIDGFAGFELLDITRF